MFIRSCLFFKPALLALLAALLVSACASTAHARDLSEYGYYLGVRLKMYREAETLLTRLKDSGKNEEEKARARSALARVYKSWADDDFSKNADDAARDAGYERAEAVYGAPEDQEGKIELAVLRIELARSRARGNPEGARTMVGKALESLLAERALLEGERNKLGEKFNESGKIVANYRQTWLYVCVARYVTGLTHPEGSKERQDHFKAAMNEIAELEFSIDVSGERIDALLLRGDIEIAARNPEGAVGRFLEVPSLMEEYPVSYESGFQALRGWLRAAELLTSDLGYEKKYLQQCIDQFQKAYTRYGSIRDLNTEFKRFRLFRISAMIKLGGDVKGPLGELFELASDTDSNFKRQALSVLGDICAGENLDAELRLKCGRLVIKDALIVGYGPVLKVLRGYQILLTQLNSTQAFETYGPECYYRLGMIYADLLARYVDAAMLYREACLRSWFMRSKFGGSDEAAPAANDPLPEHMKGKCDIVYDTKTAFEFPGEMAKAFAKVASWLNSAKFGDPGNKEFERMKVEADELKARTGDQDALFDLDFQTASKLYNDGKFSQAAVRYSSLPVRYKKFRLAMYYAGNAYEQQINNPGARHPSRVGDAKEQETAEWMAEQRARHATDFAALPKQLWEKQDEVHFTTIADNAVKTDVAMWHKALYFFKKYMLVVVLRNWDDVKERINPEKDDLVAAFLAVAERMQEKWLAQPERTRKPSDEMEMMGRAAFWYAQLLRNPAKSDPKRQAIRDGNRSTALRILKRHWELFGGHFLEAAEVQSAVLELSFYSLAEEMDGDACESLLRSYEAFIANLEAKTIPELERDWGAMKGASPEEMAAKERLKKRIDSMKKDLVEKKKRVSDMVSRVYFIYIDTLNPKVQSLTTASTALRSLFNQMKVGTFTGEGAFVSNAEKVKAYNASKSELERNKMLAQFFWDEWLARQSLGGEKNPAAAVAPELIPVLKKKWDEFAELYPKRWGEAVKADCETQLKEKSYDAVRADIQKLISGCPATEIIDKLNLAKSDTSIAAEKAGLLSALVAQISLNTQHMRFFVGTTFIYEFGAFLEETGKGLDERMRPLLTKVLTYYERYRETRQGGPTAMNDKDMYVVGKQYFRVGDYKRAATYLQGALDELNKQKFFGSELTIAVSKPTMTAGLSAEGLSGPNSTRSGDELELKYQLGRSYYEIYKQTKNVDDLKKAAALVRRAYCFVLLRNANEMAKSQRGGQLFQLKFKREIELYYLETIDTLTLIYMELHALKGPPVDYPAFVDQFNVWLDPEAKDAATGKAKLQDLPKTEADYLYHARRIHGDQWTSFSQLDDHLFRPEWRRSIVAWVALMTTWVEKYGKQGMGVKDLDSDPKMKSVVDETITTARNKSLPNLGYEDEGTKKFKSSLKAEADKLEAAWKKLK